MTIQFVKRIGYKMTFKTTQCVTRKGLKCHLNLSNVRATETIKCLKYPDIGHMLVLSGVMRYPKCNITYSQLMTCSWLTLQLN